MNRPDQGRFFVELTYSCKNISQDRIFPFFKNNLCIHLKYHWIFGTMPTN